MDVHTKEQRSRNMRAIRSKDTRDEVLLAKELWGRGFRYRKNDKTVFGKPDLTFKKYKVAIFVDSEYFHGKDWHKEKFRIKTNRVFWWTKIEQNMKRDKTVNTHLVNTGWIVLRFWSKEIRKNLAYCIQEVEEVLNSKNGNIQQNQGKAKNKR
jgi:DNA mismatch endonuclease (patch repair protein)